MTTRELSWHIYSASQYKRTIQQRGISYEILVEKSVMTEDDKGLLDAYQSGSEEAFARLVTRYQRLVHNTCCRQVHATDVEDCVQAVFIVLARRPAIAARATSVAAWLHKVSYYICRNMRRDTQRRNLMKNKIVNESVFNAHSEPVDSEVLFRLDSALIQLKEAQRAAVLLHVDNNSFDEIANKLGVTKVNAIKLTQRGLQALREYFTRRGMPIAESTLLVAAGANVSSASIPCISSAKVLLNYSQTKTATLLAQSVTKYVSFGLMKGIVYTILIPLIVAAVTVIVNPNISLINKTTSLAQLPPNNAMHVAVMPPAVTVAETADDNQDLITYKQQAEIALAMKATTYSHRIFGENAANSFILEEFNNKKRHALLSAIEGWSRYDVRQAARWAVHITNKSLRYEAMTHCLTAWAKIDPLEALEWVASFYPPDDKMALEVIMSQWVAGDRDGALNYMNTTWASLSDERRKNLIRTAFFSGLAKQDPIEAMSWIMTANNAEQMPEWKNYYVSAWADKEPEEAYQWAKAQGVSTHHWFDGASAWIEREPERLIALAKNNESFGGASTLIEGVVRELISRDPERVRTLADTWPPCAKLIDDGGYWSGLFSIELAKRNPEKAMMKALTIGGEEKRMETVKSVASLWAYQQPEKAIAWFATQEKKIRYAVLTSVVAGFGEKDWPAALAWVESLSENDLAKDIKINEAVKYLNARGVTGVDWEQMLLKYKVSEKDIAYTQLFTVMAYHDHVVAVDIADKIRGKINAITLKAILKAILFSWGEDDPSAAFTWYARTADQVDVDDIYACLGEWAKKDPSQALAWVIGQRDFNDFDVPHAVYRVFSEWVKNHPQQALTRALAMEDGEVRMKALEEVVTHNFVGIRKGESHYAAGWASALEPSSTRNAVVYLVAESWARGDMDGAMRWAESLQPRAAMMAALAGIAKRKFYTYSEDHIKRVTLSQRLDEKPQKDTLREIQILDSEYLKGDFQEVLKFLASLDDTPQKSKVQRDVALPRYLAMNVEMATIWISEITPGPGRENVINSALSYLWTIRSEDPKGALLGLQNLTPILHGIKRELTFLGPLVKALAKSQPETMAKWVMQLQDDDIKIISLGAVVDAWFAKDTEQANVWFKSFDAVTRERVIQKYPSLQKFEKPKAQDASEF